jgi:hypothetical protein
LLREEARQCVSAKRYAQALEALTKLEALEPAEPEWPRRAAECHAAIKRPTEQADALARAAERFDKARAVNKAEALCRISLSIDPRNARARSLLDEIERLAEQTRSLAARRSARPKAAPRQSARPKPAAIEASRRQARLVAQSRLELALRERRARSARVDSKK